MGLNSKSFSDVLCTVCKCKIGYSDISELYLGNPNVRVFHEECAKQILKQIREGVHMAIICGQMKLTYQGYENVMYKQRGRKSSTSSAPKKVRDTRSKLERLMDKGVVVEEC